MQASTMTSIISSSSGRHFKHFFSAALAGAVSLSAFAGCDSNVSIDDDGNCCLMDPQCPEGFSEVDACSTGDCVEVEACCTQKLCEPGTCTEAPACDSFETQVDSCEGFGVIDCHSVTACGATIFCSAEEFCGAAATCDEGDVEQTSGVCPDDAVCYPVEICGSTILCADNGLPHGCPPSPPVQGEPCSDQGLVCDYPINFGECLESWSCLDPFVDGGNPEPVQPLEWTLLGTACEETNG